VDAAHRAVEKVGQGLGIDTIAAAQAIIDIAVAKMSLAVREVSVAKGYDPRDIALVASGGAGPLHVIAIARELNIPKVIVPLYPSHFSALGMLLADERHDFIRTFYCDLAALDFAALLKTHHEMVEEANAALRHHAGAERAIHLDLRYVGQEFTLQVPVSVQQIERADRTGIRSAFDALYEQRYAHHSPDEPVEMVNVRVAVIGKRQQLAFPSLPQNASLHPPQLREVYLRDTRKPVACPVHQRGALAAASCISGPALIQEHGTTTVLFEGDVCTVAPSGELIIAVGAG
jgi:N-methylhydantoinase A